MVMSLAHGSDRELQPRDYPVNIWKNSEARLSDRLVIVSSASLASTIPAPAGPRPIESSCLDGGGSMAVTNENLAVKSDVLPELS
jgi:hypothetical protein